MTQDAAAPEGRFGPGLLFKPSPFDVPLSPRQVKILDFGWEVMKHQNVAHLFLWLAEDGWQGGSELTAWQHDPGHMAVNIKPWEKLILPLHTTLN